MTPRIGKIRLVSLLVRVSEPEEKEEDSAQDMGSEEAALANRVNHQGLRGAGCVVS